MIVLFQQRPDKLQGDVRNAKRNGTSRRLRKKLPVQNSIQGIDCLLTFMKIRFLCVSTEIKERERVLYNLLKQISA